MPFDPANPKSIFEPGALDQYAEGLQNAYRLRHNLPGGDPTRKDVRFCTEALLEAERDLETQQ